MGNSSLESLSEFVPVEWEEIYAQKCLYETKYSPWAPVFRMGRNCQSEHCNTKEKCEESTTLKVAYHLTGDTNTIAYDTGCTWRDNKCVKQEGDITANSAECKAALDSIPMLPTWLNTYTESLGDVSSKYQGGNYFNNEEHVMEGFINHVCSLPICGNKISCNDNFHACQWNDKFMSPEEYFYFSNHHGRESGPSNLFIYPMRSAGTGYCTVNSNIDIKLFLMNIGTDVV